ncbi:HpaII family restriction endonuclease [Sphingobacterium hungaricum]
MRLKGNKGEWSELYVLLKLISDGKLFQSDIELNKDNENVYEVISAFKDEFNYKLNFFRDSDIQIYQVNEDSKKIHEITLLELSEINSKLLSGILNGKGKAFEILEINSFLEQCKITKIKADTTTKADIRLKIYDYRLAKESNLGFSIKSFLGDNSTLFNTGPGNNFIYKITNNHSKKLDVSFFNKETYKPSGRKSKIAERIQKLTDLRYELSFKEIESKQLWRNLKMIDGDLPEILSYSLFYRWFYEKKTLKEISNILEEQDPLNFYEGTRCEQRLYEYKIKRFLTESAMGMTSEKPWFGEYDAFGGVIVVKEDGDIVCFHVYDFNLFRNYLINNTIFEQASTGESEQNPGTKRIDKKTKKYFYGWLYENEGLELKINLQVRFK